MRSFLITIDTEGDDQWSRPRTNTTRNSAFLPRFQSLCERYGFKPTYLTNYEMAMCPVYQDFAADALRRRTAEVGLHIHAWDSPPLVPLTADDLTHHPYLMEYPEQVIRDKVAFLTDLLQDTFRRKMLSHRAGRWGMNRTYARALIDHGYRVDCSVTPLISWAQYKGDPRGKGGADFTGFPDRAYFMDWDDISRPGTSPLLEIPLTVVAPRSPLLRRVQRLLKDGPRILRGPLFRVAPPIRRLVPDGTNLRGMLAIVRRAAAERRDYLEFALHSSELMPGGSPRFRTADAIEALYRHMEELFGTVAARSFGGATLSEYYADFAARQTDNGTSRSAPATIARAEVMDAG